LLEVLHVLSFSKNGLKIQ